MAEKYPKCEDEKKGIEDAQMELAELTRKLSETKDPEETKRLTGRILKLDEESDRLFYKFASCAIESHLKGSSGGEVRKVVPEMV